MGVLQKTTTWSVQHAPSSESFQVYMNVLIPNVEALQMSPKKLEDDFLENGPYDFD
jgi:hypothetical protein